MDLTSLTYLTSFLPLQLRFLSLYSANQSSRDLGRLEHLEHLASREARHPHFHLVALVLRSGLRDPENECNVRNVDTHACIPCTVGVTSFETVGYLNVFQRASQLPYLFVKVFELSAGIMWEGCTYTSLMRIKPDVQGWQKMVACWR